jgi:alpha-tubulin suppressor-like RCC1 family protein
LAIKADGSVVGWGIGLYQQPFSVPDFVTNIVALSTGAVHALALKEDGTVVGWITDWGFGDRAETPPGNLTDVIAIAAGGRHSLALKKDGTVVGWGNNDHGAAEPPAGLTGVIAIAAGWDNSLALKSDGTVVGWGWNWSGSSSSGGGPPQPGGDWLGQSTPPTGLNNVVAIAAGNGCFAVKRDGTVVQWGMYNAGNYTIPAGLKGVFRVEAGPSHVLVIRFNENSPGQ